MLAVRDFVLVVMDQKMLNKTSVNVVSLMFCAQKRVHMICDDCQQWSIYFVVSNQNIEKSNAGFEFDQ